MPSPTYTPLDVRSLGNDMAFDHHVVSPVQREAAARAIIRAQQRKRGTDNWDSTKGILHPLFTELNGPNVTAKERELILQMTWEDICDAVRS